MMCWVWKKCFKAFVLVMHFKACQCATTKFFFCKNLRYVSIKIAQENVYKIITWPKNMERVRKNGKKHVSIQVFPQGN
jgi:hypothetical protein